MASKGSPWYWLVVTFVREVIFRLNGGLLPLHKDRIPQEGPVLFAPIHLSHLDPPAVGVLIPRHVRIMAKKELFFFPMGLLIRSIGAFPISRSGLDKAAIATASKILADGGVLMIFPEGTRGDGKVMGKFQSGLYRLAEKSGALVIPVGISGTEQSLPKGKNWPKRVRITVCFGEPFRTTELPTQPDAKKPRDAFTLELERRIQASCREAGLEVLTFTETHAPTG